MQNFLFCFILVKSVRATITSPARVVRAGRFYFSPQSGVCQARTLYPICAACADGGHIYKIQGKGKGMTKGCLPSPLALGLRQAVFCSALSAPLGLSHAITKNTPRYSWQGPSAEHRLGRRPASGLAHSLPHTLPLSSRHAIHAEWPPSARPSLHPLSHGAGFAPSPAMLGLPICAASPPPRPPEGLPAADTIKLYHKM